MSKTLIKYLFLVLWCFLILEIAARIVINIQPFYERYIKNVSEAGHRLDLVKSLKNSYLNSNHTIKQYHPTRGQCVQPNISDYYYYKNKIVNTNSRGIRGKMEYDYEKKPGQTRVLILGDSYTFGLEVSDNETYPYYLQQLLPQSEIMNFGVSGYGHDQMLIYLQEEGVKYHPDIVILGFHESNGERNLLDIFYKPKPRFLLSNGRLVLLNSPVQNKEDVLIGEFWRSKLFDLISILRYNFMKKMGMLKEESRKITYRILQELVDTARQNHAQVIFVYLNDIFTATANNELTQDEAEFAAMCKKINVPIIFSTHLDKSLKKKGYLKEGHYAPFVYQHIAENIKEYLLRGNVYSL